MRKRQLKIPYVSWREGRPRFAPGPKMRDAGHAPTDLRHPTAGRIDPSTLLPGMKNEGAWFSAGEATDWSVAFSKRLEAQAAAPKKSPGRPRAAAPRVRYSVQKLIDDWLASPAVTEDLAEKTRYDYRAKSRVIEQAAPDIWGADVDVLDQTILFGLYEDLRMQRGLSTANGVVRVISAAISWGLRRGKFRLLKANPAMRLGMKTPAPRVRFATRTELQTQIDVADAVGRPEMGDSFVLAVWSGQRQGDRLELTMRGEIRDRIVLRQQKTGAIVQLPASPELTRRLDGAAARRRAAGIVDRHVLLFEKTWQPFKPDHYRKIYAEIRRIGVHGLWRETTGEGGSRLLCPSKERFKHLPVENGRIEGPPVVAPCPTLASFWEMDFRDTAVTWLALAGATIPEIAAVTGHSHESCTQILKHYLAQHPEMASSAIAKMIAWYDAEGETEIGL
ncbi:site-specific integrase [Stappia taiwanensis]|uniref:Site-specific integrase n=1 Tax=Stappia taiwanensis TaxID=992267 RepID=A0A838XTQ0_9HYPH|nr:site-specific integrase [Stappia taiwanensis]MBA4613812.1 site-specific integrase [Stappia taiwanensis]GGE79337.1 hypothetical protein GCM10007285_03960 [Stappia taiwanensis]